MASGTARGVQVVPRFRLEEEGVVMAGSRSPQVPRSRVSNYAPETRPAPRSEYDELPKAAMLDPFNWAGFIIRMLAVAAIITWGVLNR